MPLVDITPHGTEKLLRLAAAIQASGDKNLKRELDRALRRAGRPLLRSARQGAIQILPYHGGLNERVAASRFTSVVRRGQLRITATAPGRRSLSRMDHGSVRHPVFGNKKNWVTERVNPGWFTKPLTLDAPKQKPEIDRAIVAVARQLEAEGG